jgi:hypothetical protein
VTPSGSAHNSHLWLLLFIGHAEVEPTATCFRSVIAITMANSQHMLAHMPEVIWQHIAAAWTKFLYGTVCSVLFCIFYIRWRPIKASDELVGEL